MHRALDFTNQLDIIREQMEDLLQELETTLAKADDEVAGIERVGASLIGNEEIAADNERLTALRDLRADVGGQFKNVLDEYETVKTKLG